MLELLAGSSVAFVSLAIVLGLLVGSFLNVVIHRLPRMLEREWQAQAREVLAGSAPAGEADAPAASAAAAPAEPPYNLVVPRSACPACNAQITALQNIPLVSWLVLRGRCANCQAPISVRYPLVEALESVAGATGNIVYENAVMKNRDEVATGQRLQRAMENTGMFPNMVVQMIAVGEDSGSLDAMSGKVASFYEEDVDNAVDSMSSLLEPLIMAILGVLVGGLVIAMYLPIFKLGSVV